VTPARKRLLEYWEAHSTDEQSPPLFGKAGGDPLDAAIIGLSELPPAGDRGWREVWVYDGRKVRDILMAEEGVPEDEVDEHISYNLDGSCTADGPVLVWPLTSDE